MPAQKEWAPEYSHWRHGGWYVSNIDYPEGYVACCYPENGKWFLVEDTTKTPFPSRDAAARAARVAAAMLAEVHTAQARVNAIREAQAQGEQPHIHVLDRPKGEE